MEASEGLDKLNEKYGALLDQVNIFLRAIDA